MNKRSLYQSFGYGVKEPSIQGPELAMEGLRELAKQGYDLVRVFLRGSNFEWRSPEYVSLIAKMTEEARRIVWLVGPRRLGKTTLTRETKRGSVTEAGLAKPPALLKAL